VSAEKIKYMLLSHHHNAGQNNDIKIINKSFGNVVQFNYVRMTVTNQNLIPEEIKRRSNSVNTCCHSVQNRLYSRPRSNVKIRIKECIVLPVVLYGCET
jgi:hypothetical protein